MLNIAVERERRQQLKAECPGEFDAWVLSNGYALEWGVRVSCATVLTHTSLDGFKFSIPAAANDDMLRVMALCLAQGKQMFMIERWLREDDALASRCHLHFDLDVVQAEAVGRDEMLRMCGIVGATVCSFYPDMPSSDSRFRQVVCGAPSKAAPGADGSACVKTGFHLTYPGLVVSQAQCLYIRESCIAKLRLELGARPSPCNTWEDVVDVCVYTSNGLRMLGNCKASKCAKCRGVRSRTCSECRGAKYVNQWRPYMPVVVLSGDGEELSDAFTAIDVCGIKQRDVLAAMQLLDPDDDAADRDVRCELRQARFLAALRATTIRVQEGEDVTAGHAIPEGAPVPAMIDGGGKTRRCTGDKPRDLRYAGDTFRSDTAPRKLLKDDSTLELSCDTKMAECILGVIRRMAQPYANIELNRMFRMRKKTGKNKGEQCFIVRVRGFGSNYCLNVGRDHTSSSVFFFVDAYGVSQRCYCKNQKVGEVSGVRCQKWRSALSELPYALKMVVDEESPDTQARLDQLQRQPTDLMDEKTCTEHRLKMLAVRAAIPCKPESSQPPKKRRKRGSASSKAGDRHAMLSGVTRGEVAKMGMMELWRKEQQDVSAAAQEAADMRAECFLPLPPVQQQQQQRRRRPRGQQHDKK